MRGSAVKVSTEECDSTYMSECKDYHRACRLIEGLKLCFQEAQELYLQELNRPSFDDPTKWNNDKSHEALQMLIDLRDAIKTVEKYRG